MTTRTEMRAPAQTGAGSTNAGAGADRSFIVNSNAKSAEPKQEEKNGGINPQPLRDYVTVDPIRHKD